MTHGPARGGRVDQPPSEEAREWLRRMRLERQLHDGASLRISALALRLGLFRGHSDDQGFQDAVSEVQDELHAVLDELREVSGQIYPPLLDQAGLGPALRELVARAGLPVSVQAGGERFGTAAEGAAYFGLADVLAALEERTPVQLVVRGEDRAETRTLVISLTGVPACHAGLMTHRVEALGGSVTVTAATSAPTATAVTTVANGASGGDPITVRIPCE